MNSKSAQYIRPKTVRAGAHSVLGFLFLLLLSGGVAFAHGEAVEGSDPTVHPVTQIGLPEASMGHDHSAASGALSGATRGEIAALIADSQAEENFRSTVRFILLSLAIIGLIYLFYPRSRSDDVVTVGETEPIHTISNKPFHEATHQRQNQRRPLGQDS